MTNSSTAPSPHQEQGNPWRESLEQRLRERMRELIAQVLEEEVEDALGAQRSQRAAGRCGYRHGSKPRRLVLRGGAVGVAVPRARCLTPDGNEREWQSQLLPGYRRSTPEVEQAVLGVYLSGGNTRRIRAALSPLLAQAPLSKSAVSRLVARLGGRLPGLAEARPGRRTDRVSLPGCDLPEGAQRGKSRFAARAGGAGGARRRGEGDRKSTRLNSSHVANSYAVFCLIKKKW